MKIFTFGITEEPVLPEKPRPAIRFGCGDDTPPSSGYIGATKLTEQQQRLEDTAKHVDASITSKQKVLEAQFSKPLPAAELFDIMVETHRKTAIMASSAKDLSGQHDDIKEALTEAEKKARSLLIMARLLRDDPTKVPQIKAPLQPNTFWSNEFKVAAAVPYIYTKMLLHREVKTYGTLTNVANIPSGVISYVANQAGEGAKSIIGEVPTWVMVLLGALGLAYVTNTALQAKTLIGAKTA